MSADNTLPAGFELVQARACGAIVRLSVKDRLLGLGILEQAKFEATLSGGRPLGGGRGGAVSVALDASGTERAVIRHYRRGGLLGRLLGDRYLTGVRAVAELCTIEAARAAGVPAPECLAAVVRRRGIFNTADLIVREVPDAVPLDEWLGGNVRAAAMNAVRDALADAFGRLVAAKIFHPDLHAGNVLVQMHGNRPVVSLIDFDQARQLRKLPPRLRNLMLFRFNRALVKRGLAPRPVGLADRVRFCRRIGIAVGPRDMRRLAADCGSHLKRHSWRY